MKTDYTVKELFEKVVVPNDIDVITIYKDSAVMQCDNPESLAEYYEDKVKDYEIDYYTDDGLVYLDIYI